MCSARRTAPTPSSLACPAERALRTARTNRVDPDGDDADDDRVRPGRDLRGDEDVEHEQDDGHEVEDAVRDYRPGQCRPDAAPPVHVPRQHAHAGELADASGQDCVRQHADAEGRKTGRNFRRVGERLTDDEYPGDRPRRRLEAKLIAIAAATTVHSTFPKRWPDCVQVGPDPERRRDATAGRECEE